MCTNLRNTFGWSIVCIAIVDVIFFDTDKFKEYKGAKCRGLDAKCTVQYRVNATFNINF